MLPFKWKLLKSTFLFFTLYKVVLTSQQWKKSCSVTIQMWFCLFVCLFVFGITFLAVGFVYSQVQVTKEKRKKNEALKCNDISHFSALMSIKGTSDLGLT